MQEKIKNQYPFKKGEGMKYFAIIFAFTATSIIHPSSNLDDPVKEHLRDANESHLSSIAQLADSLEKEAKVVKNLREDLQSERQGWRRTLSNMKYFCCGVATVVGIYHITHMIHGNSRPSTLCEKPLFKKFFG